MSELDTPLTRKVKKPGLLARLPKVSLPIFVASLFLLLGGTIAGLLIFDDPLGGEPRAMVAINSKPAEPAPAKKPEAAPPATEGEKPAGQVVTIIDGMSGKRTEVRVATANPAESADSQSLSEKTRHGDIPRIAGNGTKPLDIYAAKAPAPTGPDRPRIAIMVGGLGISASATADAISRLPAAVTFGFAPYGNDLDKIVARARDKQHEIILQLPMEPFDYPDNDPGPQTLLTSLQGSQNIDRLHWFMSRFSGYAGIANYMGARFTASEPAMTPVVEEIGKRGLLWLDDGSSPRSLASQLVGAAGGAFVKADLVIDQVATPGDIDGALASLEAIARERGQAIGVATALPVSINKLAGWLKMLESRGFTIVPVTALSGRPKANG